MTKENLVGALAHGIADHEGFYRMKSRAGRNNNPGNLRTRDDNADADGFARYNTVAQGWRALDFRISQNIDAGLTLTSFFETFAPAVDKRKPLSYAIAVASYVKKNFGWSLPLDKPLNTLCP